MKIILSVFFIAVLVYSYGFTAECHVDKTQDNKVIFYSDAPLEDIEGVTDRIDGYVYWEGELVRENSNYDDSEFHFEVTLDAIDTGIGLRNRHMRENYLETDKYPYAQYTGKLTKVEEISENRFTVTSNGTFSIHGVENELVLTGAVTKVDDRFHIHFEFELNLNDYNIEVPKLMFLKVSETVLLELDFYVQTVQSES